MADRVEREIEEILARLDKDLPPDSGSAPDRQPISITSARDVRAQRTRTVAPRKPRVSMPFEPATLLIAGAVIMIVGFVLASAVASALIWLSFAGVVVFLAAFAWSFLREKPTQDATYAPGKVFWRDRYIDAHPSGTSATDKIRRRFRR